MLGLPNTLEAVAWVLSSFISLDLPIASPGGKPPVGSAATLEELIATRKWIPAAKLLLREEALDLHGFPQEDADAIRSILGERMQGVSPLAVSIIPRSSCTTSLEVHDRSWGGTTLDEMLKSSTGIYSGRIVSEEPGFLGGLPVLLVKLKIDSIIRSVPGYHGDFLDVFYPHAHFAVHGYKICGIADDGGFDPMTGDHVLVFAAQNFPERGTPAWLPAPEQVAIQSADGRIFLPSALRLDRRLFAVDSLGEMEKVLRHILIAPSEPPRRQDPET
jgi:hypothetical protein